MEGDGQEHHANTDHAKWIATNEPLNKHTLGLIGMNQEALQIFVDRFDSAVIASELLELLELLASEKLKRAILINTISKAFGSQLILNDKQTQDIAHR
jgi:hypothetical protein